MADIATQIRGGAAAFTFLTRVPSRWLPAHGPEDLANAAAWFPVVGIFVGLAGAGAFALSAMIWPPLISVIVSTAFTVWMTGAFHEDALADSLDGFGGGWTKEQVLAIMKDSRVGSYALVGVALVLMAKVACLNVLNDVGGVSRIARALIAAHVLGRWSSVALLYAYEYVRIDTADQRTGTGRPFVGRVSLSTLTVATLVAIGVAGVALRMQAVQVFAVAAVITVIAGGYFRRRIGGITGDALGATNQFVELATYLVLTARL